MAELTHLDPADMTAGTTRSPGRPIRYRNEGETDAPDY
jgi:hypothetical protein